MNPRHIFAVLFLKCSWSLGQVPHRATGHTSTHSSNFSLEYPAPWAHFLVKGLLHFSSLSLSTRLPASAGEHHPTPTDPRCHATSIPGHPPLHRANSYCIECLRVEGTSRGHLVQPTQGGGRPTWKTHGSRARLSWSVQGQPAQDNADMLMCYCCLAHCCQLPSMTAWVLQSVGNAWNTAVMSWLHKQLHDCNAWGWCAKTCARNCKRRQTAHRQHWHGRNHLHLPLAAYLLSWHHSTRRLQEGDEGWGRRAMDGYRGMEKSEP